MSTSLAIVKDNNQFVSPISEMDSESLGVFVRDGMIGIATKLVELKPCVEELWRRLDRGEVILGCATKKEFCQQVLQRTPRAVRYMLEGGNHNRGETVSPSKSHVTDAEFVEYEQAHPEIRKSTANLIGRGMAPTDVVGALVGMNYSKPMAEAAVRSVTEQSPVVPSPERDVQLELCSRTDPRYESIRENHYVENHGCIGQQAHFLIHYKGSVAGIISGASPVYATSPRDQFFGLTRDNKDKLLQGIVNNAVFRLEIQVRNLATQVLAVWREIIPHYWYENYGRVVYGFETFVVETDSRKGTLYTADNWTFTGPTQGKTKKRNGIEKPASNWISVNPKLVYCRWRDGFTAPCSAHTPDWVRKNYGGASGKNSLCVPILTSLENIQS